MRQKSDFFGKSQNVVSDPLEITCGNERSSKVRAFPKLFLFKKISLNHFASKITQKSDFFGKVQNVVLDPLEITCGNGCSHKMRTIHKFFLQDLNSLFHFHKKHTNKQPF